MKTKEISWLYNIALFGIILLMIPIIDFSNKNMLYIVGIISITLLIDLVKSIMNFIWFKQEENYIKSFDEVINRFYRVMHEYFAKNDKTYPDNSYDIISVFYRLLINNTDMIEYDYEIYITKGAVCNLANPHYWITIFSKDDYEHKYPFIIDPNQLRYKADRNMSFNKVLNEYKTLILSINDKEFKNYRPYTFMEFEENTNRSITTRNRTVYIAPISIKNVSNIDYNNIDKLLSKKIKKSIERNIINTAYGYPTKNVIEFKSKEKPNH